MAFALASGRLCAMVKIGPGWGFKVRRPIDRSILIALAAVMMAAALAACGRKGPLDAPPSAALTPPPAAAAARPSLGEESDSLASQSGAAAPARPQAAARQAAAPAPRPAKTSFFLDFLLGR